MNAASLLAGGPGKRRYDFHVLLLARVRQHIYLAPQRPFHLRSVAIVNDHKDLEVCAVVVGTTLIARWSKRVPLCHGGTQMRIALINYGDVPRVAIVRVSGVELRGAS